MTTRSLFDLLLLAAIWGLSFIFMRIAVPEFGPVPLMAVRVGVAALFLLPVLVWRGGLTAVGQLGRNSGRLVLVGTLNSAVPFTLFAYATLLLTAGFTSILNATVPLWGAAVAYFWLKERPSRAQLLGLALGLAGVVLLVWRKASFEPGGAGLAILAALLATLSYGIGAIYARLRLGQVDAIVSAAGSQLGAALILVPCSVLFWPGERPSLAAWSAAVALGIVCTGFAYVLFFRLIMTVGPTRAVTVTFLVPIFAVAWGGLLLGESITVNMMVGGLITLAGTALVAGLPGWRGRVRD